MSVLGLRCGNVSFAAAQLRPPRMPPISKYQNRPAADDRWPSTNHAKEIDETRRKKRRNLAAVLGRTPLAALLIWTKTAVDKPRFEQSMILVASSIPAKQNNETWDTNRRHCCIVAANEMHYLFIRRVYVRIIRYLIDFGMIATSVQLPRHQIPFFYGAILLQIKILFFVC